MIIGDRLREMREAKKLSPGDIVKRTGLLRCYISRVENGHTVPAIETLEKLARALEVPLYSTMAKSPPNFQTFLSGRPLRTLPGAAPVKMPAFSANFAAC
jgi:transcriptional regulator with XRE-family HTH domain